MQNVNMWLSSRMVGGSGSGGGARELGEEHSHVTRTTKTKRIFVSTNCDVYSPSMRTRVVSSAIAPVVQTLEAPAVAVATAISAIARTAQTQATRRATRRKATSPLTSPFERIEDRSSRSLFPSSSSLSSSRIDESNQRSQMMSKSQPRFTIITNQQEKQDDNNRGFFRMSHSTTAVGSLSQQKQHKPIMLLAMFMLCHMINVTSAFQYDIWFKYPHPYTVSDPVTYCPDDVKTNSCQSQMPVYVNTLDSPKTLITYTVGQLLDFCPLADAREYDHSAHTEWDDNIRLAPFDVKFGRNEECKILCRTSYKMSSHADLYRLEEMRLGITRDYYHHWFTDTFPASWCYRPAGSGGQAAPNTGYDRRKECFIGFPLGYSTDERGLPEDERVAIGNFSKPNALFLFNHFDFTFYYENGEAKSWAPPKVGARAGRITAFRVQPRSIKHSSVDPTSTAANQAKCSWSELPMEIPSYYHYGLNVTMQIAYSYSVKFIEDEPSATWTQRWHRLESTLPNTGKGKWILALAVMMLLGSLVSAAYAIARSTYADRVLLFVNPKDDDHNQMTGAGSEEPAWKALAGDIFREPSHIGLFSVFIGSGSQFIASALLSECFAVFVSLLSTSLMIVVVMSLVLVHGFVGGYCSVRLYRTFGGDNWRTICLWVCALNPLVLFCLVVMSRNLLLLYNGSLMALNVGLFGSLMVAGVCFAFSLPSTLAGGNYAFKLSSLEFPVRPTANARQLPEQQVWRAPLAATMAISLVPLIGFWCVEAYPFYDAGGYIITMITIVTVAALSICNCYYHMSACYDYRWWWRSYMVGGCAALYYFLYCLHYIFDQLYVDSFTNAMLYIAFVAFICVGLFLLTGTIGFLVTFAYLWHTYARANPSPDMNYAVFHKSQELTPQ